MTHRYATRRDLSQKEVRLLLDYCPETGKLIWRTRLGDDLQTISFNERFAGKEAGALTPQGYRSLKIHNQGYRAHRIIWVWMTGDWPPDSVDHVDRDKSNNKWSNLRLATKSDNGANIGCRRHNKLGIKGVRLKPSGNYQAQIKKNGKCHHLGHFSTAEQAHQAYLAAARKMHGAFAHGSQQ